MDCNFQKYNELGITPLDMQGSKEEHKQAIFVLASEMASKAVKKRSCGKNRTNSSFRIKKGEVKAVSRNRDENRRRVVKGSSCAPASDKV